jgi:hypothetical protein
MATAIHAARAAALLGLVSCGARTDPGVEVGGSCPPSGGWVDVSSSSDEDDPGYIMFGDFWFGRSCEPGSPPRCMHEERGSCTLDVCDPAGGRLPKASAGTITLGWGANTKQMSPPGDNVSSGYFASGADPLWESTPLDLTITATGGDTPPFSMTVPAPGTIDVSSPSGDDLSWARDSDLQVSWTGGLPGGHAGVMISFWEGASGGSFFNASLTCSFPVEGRTGSVPAAMLSRIAKGSFAEVYIMSENRSELVLDGWELGMSAWSFGRVATGDHKSAWSVRFE